jgi:hypothetical protein
MYILYMNIKPMCTVHVPDRRRLGHVNVIYLIVLACVGGKRGKRGAVGSWIRDLKVGQFTLSIGPARAEVGSYI